MELEKLERIIIAVVRQAAIEGKKSTLIKMIRERYELFPSHNIDGLAKEACLNELGCIVTAKIKKTADIVTINLKIKGFEC